MIGYIVRRFVTLLAVLLLVTMVVFGLMHAVPGGPFSIGHQPLPPDAMANIEAKYGLNEPLWRQYLNWLGSMLHGDFGVPFEDPTTTVLGLIGQAWPITLIVGGLTIFVSYLGGILIGVFAALRHNTWLDWVLTSVVSGAGIALPN